MGEREQKSSIYATSGPKVLESEVESSCYSLLFPLVSHRCDHCFNLPWSMSTGLQLGKMHLSLFLLKHLGFFFTPKRKKCVQKQKHNLQVKTAQYTRH